MKKLIAFYLVLCSFQTMGAIWRVGPSQTYQYCSQVVAKVGNGDTVWIDAATYENDAQVRWTANNLLIQGVGGRPVLKAGSKIASDPSNGKGIFVIGGQNITIENLTFRDAVVQSHNGAGIRAEGANLTVRHCRFEGNEMGILQGGTIANCTILVEFCIFFQNGSKADPGFQHNIYINHIDTFIFRYNYTYDASDQGHELKSRATNNYILYNRIANFSSIDSRNIDLPNGGQALLLGNIIEQGQNSANSNIIGYGLEGLSNPGPHHLFLLHNTVVNYKDKGSFVQVAGGTDSLTMLNNVFCGAKTAGLLIGSPSFLDSSNNFIHDNPAQAGFVAADLGNYTPQMNSPLRDRAKVLSGTVMGVSKTPVVQYSDSANVETRPPAQKADIGAIEAPEAAGIRAQVLLPLFPNPVGERLFFLGVDVKTEVRMYNASGVLVKTVLGDGREGIEVADLPDGLYFILIEDPKGSISGRFIKVN